MARLRSFYPVIPVVVLAAPINLASAIIVTIGWEYYDFMKVPLVGVLLLLAGMLCVVGAVSMMIILVTISVIMAISGGAKGLLWSTIIVLLILAVAAIPINLLAIMAQAVGTGIMFMLGGPMLNIGSAAIGAFALMILAGIVACLAVSISLCYIMILGKKTDV